MDDGETTPTETPKRLANLMPPWKPGQSGNPKGRPKGSRHKLQEDFFKALQEDFEENGVEVFVEMRTNKPSDYARMIAGLMPKEITGEDGAPLFPDVVEWRRVSPND